MIGPERINHIVGVARFLKDEGIRRGWDEDKQQELFVMGMLHDLGYEFIENGEESEIFGEFLERQNYKYWQEIYWHGVPYPKYESLELDLLRYADMHIDGKGNFVSYEGRLAEIAHRRGINTKAYTNSEKIIEELRKRGFM
jgi:hypothetical protein